MIFFNFPLEIAIISMAIAQLLKIPIHYMIYKEWFPQIIFSTGGMPSSHSAFVASVAVAIGLTEGVSNTNFAVAVVLALVVIHDSMGVRREAGKHATVLNKMAEEVNILVHEVFRPAQERDNEAIDKNLKELLGHEPIEAFSGTILGIIIALIGYAFIII